MASISEKQNRQSDIFREEIYFKDIRKVLPEDFTYKTLKLLENLQSEEGYFITKSPLIYHTYYLLGILKILGQKPSTKTIKFLKSLQPDFMGFSEMPGEVAWLDKTVLGLEIKKWFNIRVKNSKNTINFFRDFQNEDGGFGSLIDTTSNEQNTIDTLKVLKLLGTKPKNKIKVIDWVKKNFNLENSYKLFNFFYFTKSKKVNPLLIDILEEFTRKFPFENSFFDYYHFLMSHKILSSNIYKYTFIRELATDHYINNPFIILNNASEAFYAAKILQMFDYKIPNKKVITNIIKSFELNEGGYFIPGEIHTLPNNFAFILCYMLNKCMTIKKEKFIKWLIDACRNDHWTATNGISSIDACGEYTSFSLLSLRLASVDLNNSNIRKKILTKTINDLGTIIRKKHNNYTTLRTIKNSLEILMLLEENPTDIPKLLSTILRFKNEDGGFGEKISYMYATFWALRSLYLLYPYLSMSEKEKISDVFEQSSHWILSCLNKNGGFSTVPKSTPLMQSTYLALYSLWLINKQIKNKKTIIWILSQQKEDGGFSGSSKYLPTQLLHSFYATLSLAILLLFSKGIRNEIIK